MNRRAALPTAGSLETDGGNVVPQHLWRGGVYPSGEGYEGLGLFVHGFHEGDIWAIGCREPLRESLDFPAASMHWRSTSPAYGLLVVPTYFEGRETFPLTFFLPKWR